jgi:hypothetical protein
MQMKIKAPPDKLGHSKWGRNESDVTVVRWGGNKLTPWPLIRERTIPTERPPLVDEI